MKWSDVDDPVEFGFVVIALSIAMALGSMGIAVLMWAMEGFPG